MSERRLLLLAGDALAASAALALALWLWTFTSDVVFSLTYLLSHPLWLYTLAPAWLVLNIELYRLGNAAAPRATVRMLATTGLLTLGLYLAAFFLAPRASLPRLVVLYFIVGAFALTLGWRWLYIKVFVSPYFQRRVLVVGAGWAGKTLIRALGEYQPGQYMVVGVVDDDPLKHGQLVVDVLVLGGQECLLSAVRSYRVSDVVLAISGEIQATTFQTLLDCQAQGVPVVRMPSLYEQISGRVPLEHLDVDWVISSFLDRSQVRHWPRLLRRTLDLLGALVGLLGVGLIAPIIAAAIWLESRGPILYRQVRLGQGGRPFTMFKFRTMVPDAERGGQARWASPADQRVTRVGRLLRRTRLDEAPQFWNVLKGEMSLVGPRPERPELFVELEREIPFFRARLLVKPGITGWAQINYGYGATVADAAAKLQWDLYYIKNQSLWLDLLILLRTVGVMTRFQGT